MERHQKRAGRGLPLPASAVKARVFPCPCRGNRLPHQDHQVH